MKIIQDFQREGKEQIEDKYKLNALYKAISVSFRPNLNKFAKLNPSTQDLFFEIICVLDEIKENPEVFYKQNAPYLYKDLFEGYREKYREVDNSDCILMALIIAMFVVELLSFSDVPIYSVAMKNSIRDSIVAISAEDLSKFTTEVSKFDSNKDILYLWFNKYMNSKEFISDDIIELIDPQPKKENKEKYMALIKSPQVQKYLKEGIRIKLIKKIDGEDNKYVYDGKEHGFNLSSLDYFCGKVAEAINKSYIKYEMFRGVFSNEGKNLGENLKSLKKNSPPNSKGDKKINIKGQSIIDSIF